ncbi:RNI-like protein [Xylariaceae sp. FL1272]|nr:RNI-like protein [Xylariaceae sp. FL1272]
MARLPRPPAPALDLIAARSAANNAASSANASDNADANNNATAATEIADDRDSRSSSSTNSPIPIENEESDFYAAANDSQSSIGVGIEPGLQDMQVNDQQCLPIVHTLPSEILISIFARINEPHHLRNCMLTCKRWARNVVEILWHRPLCSSWDRHAAICRTLASDRPFFTYADFVKRLNLASLAAEVNDGSVIPLSVLTRVERLTLTNCADMTDLGLQPLVQNSPHLLALDISGDRNITEVSINTIADHCRKLQGLNVSGCKQISNDSLVRLGENCRYIKRLKLNECTDLNDAAVLSFANNCPNILEIDLHQCINVGGEPVTALLSKQQSLRELRLAGCDRIDDGAFLSLPPARTYDNLRILDLTSCTQLTDRAVEKIIDAAPRLRNLVLAKCSAITDAAVHSIARLGKNLHYVHLGHCRNITDDAVKHLVRACNRIRYIDLGCCTHLTDESVTLLAALPKLKRIGLVKCNNITDESMFALAKANDHRAQYRSANHMGHDVRLPSLERVHLSYCTNLTLPSIIKLLNCCPKLTHLSLTGVPAFLRDDLDNFCREAPKDFTEHQRAVFCVFSGNGVTGLREYLNTREEFAEFRQGRPQRRRAAVAPPANGTAAPAPDIDGFEDGDGVDDDEDLAEGSELHDFQNTADLTNLAHNPGPPPPPPPHGSDFAQLGQMGQIFTDNAQTQQPAAGIMTEMDGIWTDVRASQSWPAASANTPIPGPSSAGPSTAGGGGGLFHRTGPSTASMQGNVEDDEA